MIYVKQYGKVSLANHDMRGGILGGADAAKPFEGLVGLAVTFTAPAGTYTFTQPADTPVGQLRFTDVQTQLEAAIANLKVVNVDGKLGFLNAAGAAVTLAAIDEPARRILGFANNVAIDGLFLGGPSAIAPPRYLSLAVENGSVYITVEVV